MAKAVARAVDLEANKEADLVPLEESLVARGQSGTATAEVAAVGEAEAASPQSLCTHLERNSGNYEKARLSASNLAGQ